MGSLSVGVRHVFRDLAKVEDAAASAVRAARRVLQPEALTDRFTTDARAEMAKPLPATTGNKVDLFVDGGKVYPQLFSELAQARSSIHIVQFGFREGSLGNRLADILCERARAGVEVRLIVDAKGSQPTTGSKAMYERMAQAGVQVVTQDMKSPLGKDGVLGGQRTTDLKFDEVGAYDHRKLYVIDGQRAWTGGMGVEDHFENNMHDLMVRVQGPSVSQLQKLFLTSYQWLGGTVPEQRARYFPAPKLDADGMKVKVLENVPGVSLPVTDAMLSAIDHAKDRIELVTPQLSGEATLGRLAEAARRGVDVTLLVPGVNEGMTRVASLQTDYPELFKAGVKVYEYQPKVLHQKSLVVDGQTAFVGTTNFENTGLYRNYELMLQVEDPRLAQTLSTNFAADLKNSKPAELEHGLLKRAKYKVVSFFDQLW